MAEYSFVFSSQWKAVCFVCGEPYKEYDTSHRLCRECEKQYKLHPFFKGMSDLSSCFATILPEAEGIKEEKLRRGFKDLFLASGPDAVNAEPRYLLEKAFANPLLLPCGQPALFEMKRLAQFTGLGGTWVLDLSPYIWSGTLKDLRSWAVLSLAIEHNIKHLSLWTAGNAGYSLAKLVHRYNATVPEEMHKTVYCLVDTSAPSEIVVTLRSLQCQVAPIATGKGAILSREQLYHVFVSLSGEEGSYWQVTDGWDGVGVFMYSLLAQQCFYLLRSELGKKGLKNSSIYIVLPLGTGNFLLGFIRGIAKVSGEKAKIVAALPYGDHMMVPFLPKKRKAKTAVSMYPDEPEAPKLTGFYSPLSPCLWHLGKDQDFNHQSAVEFIEVDRAAQIEAAAHVLGPAHKTTIASEPSALLAFGAVKELAQRIRKYSRKPEDSVVLVVNSGFGIMGMKEQEFYTKSVFAFR